MFSPEISGTIYILSMSCISGDEIQVAIHRREDIFRWLKTLDHEGSNWSVVQHIGTPITDTVELTEEVIKEYSGR